MEHRERLNYNDFTAAYADAYRRKLNLAQVMPKTWIKEQSENQHCMREQLVAENWAKAQGKTLAQLPTIPGQCHRCRYRCVMPNKHKKECCRCGVDR